MNGNFIKILGLKLIKFKSQNVLNGTFIVLQKVDKFDLDWTISVPKSNGKIWKAFNISVDGCEFLQGAFCKSGSLTNNIMAQLDRSAGNSIPKNCPIKKVV